MQLTSIRPCISLGLTPAGWLLSACELGFHPRPSLLSAYSGQGFSPKLTHFYPHRPKAFRQNFAIFIRIKIRLSSGLSGVLIACEWLGSCWLPVYVKPACWLRRWSCLRVKPLTSESVTHTPYITHKGAWTMWDPLAAWAAARGCLRDRKSVV